MPAAGQPAPSAPSEVRVEIETGTVEGRASESVVAFKGLRYAAPPVGPLRWRPPQPAPRHQGVQAANTVGASCMQRPELSIDSGGGDTRPIAEDCLFANVWKPAGGATTGLPVMVWIHGGALVFGSGGVPLYDGAPLARRGVVVVSINYRLGALGFFAHPALSAGDANAPMNFGLLDQIAALRWVQRNVAGFGGDSRNVTIFGQSAGAQSVLALFTSPPARGLFAKGIALSPYGLPSHSRRKAASVAVRMGDALGAGGERTTAEALRRLPAEALVGVDGADRTLAPSFIVGDTALPSPILDTFQRHREAPLPLVIGNTSDDSSVALAFGVRPEAVMARLGAARVAVRALYPDGLDDAELGRQAVRDLIFAAYARRIAALHSMRAPTWRYDFDYSPADVRGQRPGVPHGSELPFMLGTLDLCGCLAGPVTDDDRRTADRMTTRLAAFAATGEPADPDGPVWPQDGMRRPATMCFAEDVEVRRGFMARRLNLLIGGLRLLEAL